MRIGIGYDIHRLAPGRRLLLGGVEIPHSCGLLGHSDADVVLHAICDAMLGAAGMTDIGDLFPDSEPAYAGADSRELTAQVVELVAARGLAVSNVDVVVQAEEPRLAPHRERMRASVASLLRIDASAVGVKATTNEGLGEVGRGEAIACLATVMLTPAAPR